MEINRNFWIGNKIVKPVLRFLLTLFTILCGTTISGASIQESHAGAVFEKTCVVFEGETPFSAEFVAPKTGLGKEIGILKDARKGKGNFGLGDGSTAASNKLGKDFVGEGAEWGKSGKALISKDGLRQYRPPTAKPNSPYAPTGKQSNFESRHKPSGKWQNNGHLDVND